MKRSFIIQLVIILVAIILTVQSAFIVNETEQAVITQFGRPVGDAITTPGLKFKVPFIQATNFFEKRFMEWRGDPNQIPTKDKKYIFVETYARWQITDPLKFYIRLKNERGAQSRIDDILDGETRDFIANYNLEELVRSVNRTPIPSGAAGEVVGDSLINIEVGREKIQKMIRESANRQAEDLGVIILDLRVKRLNYVPEVREQVYQRMQSERFRIAEMFRSEGQGEAARINGEKERDLQVIRSEAFRQAEEIKGKADAEATAIYAGAYDKTPASRELYAFTKSMETFEKSLTDDTQIILSTKNELFKYLKGVK
jgi:membrane protease subunit HflC